MLCELFILDPGLEDSGGINMSGVATAKDPEFNFQKGNHNNRDAALHFCGKAKESRAKGKWRAVGRRLACRVAKFGKRVRGVARCHLSAKVAGSDSCWRLLGQRQLRGEAGVGEVGTGGRMLANGKKSTSV